MRIGDIVGYKDSTGRFMVKGMDGDMRWLYRLWPVEGYYTVHKDKVTLLGKREPADAP